MKTNITIPSTQQIEIEYKFNIWDNVLYSNGKVNFISTIRWISFSDYDGIFKTTYLLDGTTDSSFSKDEEYLTLITK